MLFFVNAILPAFCHFRGLLMNEKVFNSLCTKPLMAKYSTESLIKES